MKSPWTGSPITPARLAASFQSGNPPESILLNVRAPTSLVRLFQHLFGRRSHEASAETNDKSAVTSVQAPVYIARKVTKARWEPDKGKDLQPGEIAADAVTRDLQTQYNKLSFWVCEGLAKENLEDAVLAIAATRDNLDHVDVVPLKLKDMTTVQCQRTNGATPIADLRERHVDLVNLDMGRLCVVAQQIATAARTKLIHRFSVKDARKIISRALHDERIALDALPEPLQARFRENAESSSSPRR